MNSAPLVAFLLVLLMATSSAEGMQQDIVQMLEAPKICYPTGESCVQFPCRTPCGTGVRICAGLCLCCPKTTLGPSLNSANYIEMGPKGLDA